MLFSRMSPRDKTRSNIWNVIFRKWLLVA